MNIQALTHIGICVASIEQSRVFYCDGLGFTPVTTFATNADSTATLLEFDKVDLQCLFIERDGVRIELMQFNQPGHEGDSRCLPLNHLGLTHLAFRVDDIDVVVERLQDLNATIMEQTRISNDEQQSGVIFVTDPDGVRIELVSMPGDPKAPLGEPCA